MPSRIAMEATGARIATVTAAPPRLFLWSLRMDLTPSTSATTPRTPDRGWVPARMRMRVSCGCDGSCSTGGPPQGASQATMRRSMRRLPPEPIHTVPQSRHVQSMARLRSPQLLVSWPDDISLFRVDGASDEHDQGHLGVPRAWPRANIGLTDSAWTRNRCGRGWRRSTRLRTEHRRPRPLRSRS